MISSDSASETKPPKVPRLTSLLHRLQHARDAAGQPIQLLDELLFFLDDPPPDTGDRWQKGADLCASHGIKTSRMSVYRLFIAEILRWRREQNPPPPTPPPAPEEIERLHDQARHLAVQRILDQLHDPKLAPAHLISFLQSDNVRRRIQLARDQFDDRIKLRHDLAIFQHRKAIEAEARHEAMAPVQAVIMRRFVAAMLGVPAHDVPGIPPHTTP